MPVDQDADECLANAGHAIHQRHDETERGIADGKFIPQQRHQRGQRHLIEMRKQVGKRDHSDHKGIGASGGICCGHVETFTQEIRIFT